MDTHYKNVRDGQLEAIKDWPAYVGFGVGGAALIASFFLSFALLMVTVGGGLFGLVKLLNNKTEREKAETNYQEKCRVIGQGLSNLYAEHTAYEKEFASYDVYYDEIRRELDCI